MKAVKLLAHINGRDEPGVTAAIMLMLNKLNARLLDIEQAVVSSHLSLHLLVESHLTPQEFQKSLTSALQLFSLQITLDTIKEKSSLSDPDNKFVVTIIANEISPKCIASITSTIAVASANINSIKKLNSGSLETIELIFSCKQSESIPMITEHLLESANSFESVNIAIQKESLYRRSKRLILFDMDSTLIKQEVIDELARYADCEKEMKALTQKAIEGHIDFKSSLINRAQLLKNITTRDMKAVADDLQLTPGTNTLTKILKQLGFKIGIISGGFTYFAQTLKEKLGLHYVYANELEFKKNKATGMIKGGIIDGAQKARILKSIALKENIPLEQVIAVGDGANDLEMLKTAGLGIAFNAKAITKKDADTALTQKSMTSILYFLGITDSEVKEMGYTITKLRSQSFKNAKYK